ncbi:fatty acid cis/trans isomerase [Vibrio mexicanus]|uniref:fatty acid cis/trans isomerase n=1 Tax=Vibrio mexicanus TaxID=1004326 RepID=UPI00063CE867|nr:fatty acid cis/trans isomerase [Vibrio mexicanus]
MKLHRIFVLAVVTVFAGCATYAGLNYDELFGQAQVRERTNPIDSYEAEYFLTQVKPIINNRCVVCHACYDAPCQLKMSSVEGIDRGASKDLVYQGARLTAVTPTRLFEDAQTTQEWRDLGFHPVLNERDQTFSGNVDAGLIARMITQKERHPLPQQDQLEGFDFSIDRTQVCPTIEELDAYEQDYPTWGMPYGMPNLSSAEYTTLMKWLQDGAAMNAPLPLTEGQQSQVGVFEKMLNRASRKHQLTARYLYEHLYLFNLYFSDLGEERPRFFQMVRSKTPPGEPVERITTRRPYDNPMVERVYYRIIPNQNVTVDKTHMPYALNGEVLANWQAWFIDKEYTVSQLPSYDVEVAANPMTAFIDLPVKARFRFLLSNAQNTINAFIKGPVCRGQLALNVINDHFWVFFVDPEKSDLPEINEFYRSQADNLRLPGELESNTLPVSNWVRFSRQQARYLEAKSEFSNEWFKSGEHVTTDIVWTGDGTNPNAALTVFRHFDSASVVQGLVGQQPKTAWIIDYALLERIHYLLVAGFDVYGNFGHQLMTRMFMDFLRLEGETNFISLLPQDMRHEEHASWYKDQSPQLSEFLQRNIEPFDQPSKVPYQTDDPKAELFDILKTQLAPVLGSRYEIEQTHLSRDSENKLKRINQIRGESLIPFPQISMIMIEADSGQQELFTLLRNNAHTNISSLFDEESNRDIANDTLTLVKGTLGSYPATFYALQESQIEDFVRLFESIETEEDYVKLLDRFAIRRSSPKFWEFSDKIHHWYQVNYPIEYGLLDYNRFENR